MMATTRVAVPLAVIVAGIASDQSNMSVVVRPETV
jgi:hypothetical protein